MYLNNGVFNIGIVVTREDLTLADALTDYSYVNAGDGTFIARCLTGLGLDVTSNGANGLLGGLYFNSTMIPYSDETASCSSRSPTNRTLVIPGPTTAGVINMYHCGVFSTSVEGIYTCTIMNSSMMDQSVTFGVYFNGRSESFHYNISLDLIIFYFSTQLLQ